MADQPLRTITQSPPAVGETGIDLSSTLTGPHNATASKFSFLTPSSKPGHLGRLGGYEVIRLLGQGGMGCVFLAEDEQLRRQVALKVMRPEIAANPTARERFLREGRAAAAVKSDHVATIYQVGEDNGTAFLVLEYLEGVSIDDWLEAHTGPAPSEFIGAVARDVLRGLAAAHAKDLIHRDIKPHNLWLEAGTERVKILDFGLTRPRDATHLTQEGAVVGTPAYMSPEQAAGRPVDARSDLFSLGVVLYTMAAGTNPFERGSLLETLGAILNAEVPSATMLPGLSHDLAVLIDRLLAKDPDRRPPSAKAVLTDSVPSAGPNAPVHTAKIVGWPLVVFTAAVALVLISLALWNRFKGSPEPEPSSVVEPVVVERFDVKIHAQAEKAYRLRGLLGAQGGVFTAQTTDAFTVEAKLSRPAYSFVIALEGDGNIVGVTPLGDTVQPTATDQPGYPENARADSKWGLEDGDGGLWIVALVASPEPLPGFSEWLQPRGKAPWKSYPRPVEDLVMRDDGRLFETFTPGQPTSSVPRGEKTDKSSAPLIRVVDWLKQGDEKLQVIAVAFPVVGKK